MLPILIVPALHATPRVHDTPPFDLASEYIRELGEFWEIQERADQEMLADKAAADPQSQNLMTAIRNATRVKIALQTDLAFLVKMRLSRSPNEQTLGLLAAFYKQKLQLQNEIVQIASAFVGGPKDGVDYGKMAARLPQITATLDEIDKSLFQMTAMIFVALIDMKGDSQNRANHLLLTKDQRATLVGSIDSAFGASLETDKRYMVASARFLKGKLLEFKCSDEPWE